MQFDNQLERLRTKFNQELPERLRHIQGLYHERRIDADGNDALRQALHRLVGVAGTFKANRISEIARNLEVLCAENHDDVHIIAVLFDHLEKAVAHYLTEQNKTVDDDPDKVKLSRSDKTVCLVEDDPLQAEQMALIFEEAGYHVIQHHALPTFAEFLTIKKQLPSLIVMDMVFANSTESGASLIRQLRDQIADFPPVIFVSVLSDTLSRIQAARAGANDYLVKPLHAETLLATADKYLRPPRTYKILIIDDDEITAEYISFIVMKAGMEPRVLYDPLLTFDVLDEFSPDLLILDIHMPHCSGIELAQAIRQCCCHSLMPIIFLTTGTQFDQELAALNSGGDEFVRKSDPDTHLLHKIHSRLQRIDQIRELNQQLLRAQKRSARLLKSQSDFLTYVVHELKSPLHAILGFGELLQADDSLTPEQTDMVNAMVRGGQSQRAIIDELSEHAKIAAGELKLSISPFEIHALLAESIEAMTLFGSKNNVTIIREFEHLGPQTVSADQQRTRQVIGNLLSNAVKYNKPGGTIRVSTQRRANGLLRISIRDTGIGIDGEDLDYIFDAFKRVDSQRPDVEGTGVGLSICSRLMQLMGGRIGVDSELNQGSHFWIELPIS